MDTKTTNKKSALFLRKMTSKKEAPERPALEYAIAKRSDIYATTAKLWKVCGPPKSQGEKRCEI